jgi:hypothetical protein
MHINEYSGLLIKEKNDCIIKNIGYVILISGHCFGLPKLKLSNIDPINQSTKKSG